MTNPTFIAGGTGVLTVTFKDENNNPVVPNEVKWTLTDYGKIVNNRKDVTETPGSKIDIVLSGADLVAGQKCLVVDATYNSSIGSALPLRGWIEFNIKTI